MRFILPTLRTLLGAAPVKRAATTNAAQGQPAKVQRVDVSGVGDEDGAARGADSAVTSDFAGGNMDGDDGPGVSDAGGGSDAGAAGGVSDAGGGSDAGAAGGGSDAGGAAASAAAAAPRAGRPPTQESAVLVEDVDALRLRSQGSLRAHFRRLDAGFARLALGLSPSQQARVAELEGLLKVRIPRATELHAVAVVLEIYIEYMHVVRIP